MHRLVLVLVLWLGPEWVAEATVQEATPTGSPAPLEDATLQALTIVGFSPNAEPKVSVVGTLGTAIGLPPGGTVTLVLGVIDYEVCGIGIRCFVPVDVAATWSVTPPDGAPIDRSAGRLTIAPSTPGGTRFMVFAEIEGGRRVVSRWIDIVTPETNPLLRYWWEAAQFQPGFPRWGQTIVTGAPAEQLAAVVALDGKSVRHLGDHRTGQSPLPLVSAWATRQRLVLAQTGVAATSNEITTIPVLLEARQGEPGE